ncbi:hypothetical protein F4781DRAFT_427803 [Annulohypoxylon bovei var. microspora]|nr:hypothetical protein F4781DRAFT_427803 [Annulohypoxylon bovei var. microspora]
MYQDARITDCRYIASYSLTDSSSPQIIIPGQPAVWEAPQLPFQLPKDPGNCLRDQNGAQFPEHPMHPSVQSIFALNEGFNLTSVDIMGCASSLGNILRFVRSVSSTFRYDVEMVGNTLFIINNQRNEVIPDIHGHGISFLENFTAYQAEMEDTKSHQRIISYSFGGLKCLVRFECDGHLENAGDISTTTNELGSLHVSEISTSNSITVKAAGVAVPQHSIVEIKTRSQLKGHIDMGEHLPRLWLRQIPNFIVGYHVKGNFEDIQEKPTQQDLREWESAHESQLRMFAEGTKWNTSGSASQ